MRVHFRWRGEAPPGKDRMTDCTGNVTRMVTLKDVTTDSYPGRYVTVDITRCTACPGSAFVTDEYGNRWKVDIPADFPADDVAAAWAAEVTLYREPFYRPPFEEPVFGPEEPPTDEELEAMAEADYLAEIDSERAYAEMLERRAENGTWWGRDPEYADF
jgi:hypothetical protein